MKRGIIVASILILLNMNPSICDSRSRTTSSSRPVTRAESTRLDRLEKDIKGLQQQVAIHTQAIWLLMLPAELRDAKPIKEPLIVGQHVYFQDQAVTVVQIVDRVNMMVELRNWPNQPIIWITGLDTSNQADDKNIRIGMETIFTVSGTRSYTTVAGGHKTVYQLTVAN